MVKKPEGFIFWWENPDLSHLGPDDELLEEHNPSECVELPDEFLRKLEEKLRNVDHVDNLLWDSSSEQWKSLPSVLQFED